MLKTATFGIMHFTIAVAVVYAFTGSLALGGLIGVIEPLINTVGYVIHERLWERFRAARRGEGPHDDTLATAS